LSQQVTILGPRDDVPRILAECDIGVLSSTSEGLPVSLLEYGAAGLAPLVTDVGQCAAVVGDAGAVVPASAPADMADQLIDLLQDSDKRQSFGQQFKQRVEKEFGAQQVMRQWIDIYQKMLEVR
jgi:glycosyltransferase involved in cell wall biosynthesis